MDENRKIGESIEHAIDLLEHPTTLTEEELRGMQEDEECLRACRDLMQGCRVLMSDIPSYTPDVTHEWAKFEERHQATRKRRILIWSAVSGVAAMFIALILFSWSFFSSDGDAEPVTVFLADNTSQQVTLQTGNGKLISLNEAIESELSAIGAQLQKKELDYNTNAPSVKEVEMHTLSTPRGADFKVVLADGTEVWLNAESRLEYPAQFVGKERLVSLRGEAYFKVVKDAEHPFIIQTDDMKTRVLGTEFNVRNYSVTDSHVTLIEGSVEVCNNKGGDYIRITPGEDAHLQPDGAFALTEVDVDAYVYWKEGFFYFDNVSLLDIMQSLGRWYNVTILFENRAAMNYRMHFLTDRKAGLEHAVMLLNRMKKVKITLENATLTVS